MASCIYITRKQNTVVHRFSRHRFSRNPNLVENFAVTNHFYSIKLQYSRIFNLVDCNFFVAFNIIYYFFVVFHLIYCAHEVMLL